MIAQEAIAILRDATGQIKASRKDHDTLITAINILGKLVNETDDAKSKKEGKKEDPEKPG